MRARQRERQREGGRKTDGQTERQRERKRETERDRKTEKGERDRERQRIPYCPEMKDGCTGIEKYSKVIIPDIHHKQTTFKSKKNRDKQIEL